MSVRFASTNLKLLGTGSEQPDIRDTSLRAHELCHRALVRALDETGTNAGSLTYLIGHTTSWHASIPPDIARITEDIDYHGPYVELRQAEAGFANALYLAAAVTSADRRSAIGIVGGESANQAIGKPSPEAGQDNLHTFLQTGAGAVLVGADDYSDDEIISDVFTGQVEDERSNHGLLASALRAIQQRGYQLREFDWILPQLFGNRVAETLSKHFPTLGERIFASAGDTGKRGSAAIWIGLDTLRKSGRLLRGQKTLVLGGETDRSLFGGFVYQH